MRKNAAYRGIVGRSEVSGGELKGANPSDWQRRKPNTPFGALPVLEMDGQTLAQSNAINRCVGTLTDLSDAWQAALCDEVMEAVEDINTKLAGTFFLPEEERKTQRKALVEGPFPFYLTRLQQRLEAHGGRYFAAAQALATPPIFIRRDYVQELDAVDS